MASKAPSPREQPEPRLEFKILVDRFGFRFDAEANRDDGWIQAALEEWERTVSSLFGDVDKALKIAGEAGLLDSYPTWPETAEALDRLRVRANAPQPPAPMQSPSDENAMDMITRGALDQLNQYVAMLGSWRLNFQLGTFAALYAGRWAIDGDERRRNMIGLQSIASVYGNDEAADQKEMFSRLSALLAPIPEKSDSPPDYGWWSRSSRWVTAGSGDFSEDAGPRLLDWLKSLSEGLSSAERGRSRFGASAIDRPKSGSEQPRFDLEAAYWDQWNWTSTGPLRATDATMFDLMHASQHGGFCMLPLRGGNLSSGQLCRIMAHFQGEATRGTDVANRVVGTVSNILGFPEFGTIDGVGGNRDEGSFSATRDAELVVVISLRASKSPAWLWRPEAGVRALVRVPPDMAAVDQIAAADSPERSRPDALMTLLKESLSTRPARVFHFIETRAGDADWPVASRAGLPLDIRVETFSFGSGGDSRPQFMRHISQRVMGVSGLLAAAREHYADAFPLSGRQRRNPWFRFRHDAKRYFTRLRRNAIRIVSKIRNWFVN